MSNDGLLAPWRPDMGDGTYQNPVLHADYSDPDILRVGDDFYLVASSFNHMPALPILHSTDLVNWRIVNHVFQRLDLPGYDAFQPGKGVWAPSIRYHDGRFWVFFSTPDEGIFMCHTTDPGAEWSAPHCLKAAKGWIDPCPFWDDDGRAWLVHAFAYSRSGRKHQLQLCEMSPDGLSLLDNGRIVVDGGVSLPTLEGPKVYKRHGWYYIFAPAGGVATGWQTVLRSRSLQGPYDGRKVLSQGGTAVNGPHQGGWVELPGGECWFMHFQDAGAYGRIVHLQPMVWHDDWPMVGRVTEHSAVGEPVSRWAKPQATRPGPAQEPQASDDFTAAMLGRQWQWQANPRPEWFRLDQAGLSLACQPLPTRNGRRSFYDGANYLLQKFPAREFEVTTRLVPALRHNGEQAGVVVYGERYACLGIDRRNDHCHLVWHTGWIGDRGEINTQSRTIGPWSDNTPAYFHIVVAQDALCTFYYGSDADRLHAIPEPFAAGPGKWVGAKIGLYAVNATDAADYNPAPPGEAAFSYFSLTAVKQ